MQVRAACASLASSSVRPVHRPCPDMALPVVARCRRTISRAYTRSRSAHLDGLTSRASLVTLRNRTTSCPYDLFRTRRSCVLGAGRQHGAQLVSRLRNTLLDILTARPDIEGRFVNIRRLPASTTGAFSLVVSAEDNATTQPVAIKVRLPGQGHYRDACFDREAELLLRLQGAPDIVQMVGPPSEFTETLTHHTGLELALPLRYYAVDLAASDLRCIIAENAWPIERLLEAFRAMCRAVQRIHAHGIAHRDIKPSNFLVMPDGSTKLSDFGTATHLDLHTEPLIQNYQTPPGDRRYCAPELLACVHGEEPTVAFSADLFSLGATLFEMCTGSTLGPRLYHSEFWDFLASLGPVRLGQRRRAYDTIVRGLANALPLPSVRAFGPGVPSAVRDRIDDLYKGLAAIDYRRRLTRFDRIFNQINTCLLILRHEAKYQRWLDEKRRRGAQRAVRHTRPVR